MGVYLPLPSEYQEVEYIQSSGTQYINCGLSLGSNNFEIDLDFTVNSFYSQEQAICSIWTSSYNYWNLFIRSSSYKTLDCYTTSHHETSALTTGTKYNAKLTRTSNSWVLSKDGVNTTRTYTPGSINNTTLKLFTRGDTPGTSSSNTHINMYSCKVSVGGNLVRDFVPCYRKSDNVVGLYDLVNNQFYTNSGTGTFTKGADVTAIPLKNAYIGEVYEFSYDFRGKTTAILTSDGWTGTMSGTINNDGISGNWGIKQGGKDFSNANKKITITVNGNVISKSAWDSGTMGLQICNSDGSLIYGGGASSLTSSGYNGARVYYHSTSSSRSSYNLAIGAYVVKCVIDLQAKTIRTDVYSNGTSVTNISASLTDAYITELKGLTYITTRTGSGTRISDINIERE